MDTQVVGGRFGRRLDSYLQKLIPVMEAWTRGQSISPDVVEETCGCQFRRIWPRASKWLLNHRRMKAVIRDKRIYVLTVEEQIAGQPEKRIRASTRQAAMGAKEVSAVPADEMTVKQVTTAERNADVCGRLAGAGAGCLKEIRYQLTGRQKAQIGG